MTGPPRSSRACTRSSQPRRSVAGKPVSHRPRFIQYPPIRNTARGMDRHAHTRPIWAKWAADQCELRETGTATTRRGGDSWACAMNPGMEIVNWANSTQVNRRGSRIQVDAPPLVAAAAALPDLEVRSVGRRYAGDVETTPWRVRGPQLARAADGHGVPRLRRSTVAPVDLELDTVRGPRHPPRRDRMRPPRTRCSSARSER